MAKIVDYYEILGVSDDATESEIRKAYRKKSRHCHPDKNKGSANIEAFHLLSEALKVLTDTEQRAAIDNSRKAKRANAAKLAKYDAKRKRLQTELEERERAHVKTTVDNPVSQADLIKRLQEEGERLIEEERQKVAEEMKARQESGARLTVTWNSVKTDSTNGGYNTENLQDIFDRYGVVNAIVVSKKKNGRAIVEFDSHGSAKLALQSERGQPANPLKISWLS